MMARGASPAAVGAVSGFLLVVAVALIVLVLTGTAEDGGGPQERLSATPVTSAAPAPAATTPTAQAQPEAAPGPREPTAGDAADFAVGYAPEGATEVETVAADLDGDGRAEVVGAYVADGRVRVDIAAWDATAYRIVFTGEGGEADELVALHLRDVNDSPQTREVMTRQQTARGHQSVSLWGWDGVVYAPLIAVDGCWDGSHTYGVTGAVVQGGRITATCDGSPEPPETWPADVYQWDPDAQAFTYLLTEQRG